jgi:hypothetical protein
VTLERGWYSSGPGELLAIVFVPEGVQQVPSALAQYVSLWGTDPTARGGVSILTPPHFDAVEHVAVAKGSSSIPGAMPNDLNGGGAIIKRGLTIEPHVVRDADGVAQAYPSALLVDAMGIQPHYDRHRKCWIADLVIKAPDAYAPFVRLALARLQPHAVRATNDKVEVTSDAHLSDPIQLDSIRLLPRRELRLRRRGRLVEVQLLGAQRNIGPAATRVATLEVLDQASGIWQSVDEKALDANDSCRLASRSSITRGVARVAVQEFDGRAPQDASDGKDPVATFPAPDYADLAVVEV